MKTLTEYIIESKEKELEKKIEQLDKDVKDAEKKAEDAEEKADDAEDKADEADKEAKKAEETITDEKSFREYAERKFEEVFGDKLDKKQMKETIDGILKDNKKAVEDGDWGKIVGILNKSFA